VASFLFSKSDVKYNKPQSSKDRGDASVNIMAILISSSSSSLLIETVQKLSCLSWFI